MNMPSVTFLMAARNAATSIASAVESAINQDYEGEIRVVVVDDASTDGTSKHIPRMDTVRVLRNESRLGRSGSRNRGLESVTSELVAIQDADDVSLPSRLRSTVPLALDGRTVVGSQLIWRDKRSGIYEGAAWPTTFGDADLALSDFRTPVPHPAMLLPTVMIRGAGGYDGKFPVAEDLELMLRLRRKYPDVKFVNTECQTVLYRRNEMDSLRYNVRSSYWRYRAQATYGHSSARASWLVDGSERYIRQRMRFIRRAATRSFPNLFES